MLRKTWSEYLIHCPALIFIAAVIFLCEFAGYWTHSLNLLFGYGLLTIATVLYWRRGHRAFFGIQTFCGLCLGIVCLTALPAATVPVRAVWLALYASALELVNHRQENPRRDLPALATAALLFSFLLTIYLSPTIAVHWPGGGIGIWALIKKISLTLSSFVSSLFALQLLAGPSFSGLFITVFFLAYIVLVSDFFRVIQYKRWLITAGLIIASQFIYLIVFATVPVFIEKYIWNSAGSGVIKNASGKWLSNHYPLFMPLLLIIGCAIVLLVFAPKIENFKQSFSFSRIIYAVIIFLLVGTGSFIINTTLPAELDNKKIVFYEKGFLNWDRPNYKSFGNYSAGMFGNLPVFAENLGMQTKMTSELNDATLHDAGILMMINVDEMLTDNELATIHAFVRNGGALLLLGDHTQMNEQGVNCSNRILKPSKIRYNFDSADFFIGGWLNSIHFMHHPVTMNIGDTYNQPGVVVGASLAIEYPAVPLLIGRYGYSDPGNPHKGGTNGYLGNLDYDPDEELGDIILVAAQDFGKGKIVVFGDTSTFANPLLVNTYQFAGNILAWLRQPGTTVISKWWTLLGMILFIAALGFLTLGGLTQVKIVAMASALLIFNAVSNQVNGLSLSIIPVGNVAYIDNSHFENFQYEGWDDSGNTGLIYNVMRAGFSTFSMNQFSPDRLNAADLFIIANPTKYFSDKEIGHIRSFVENGGSLLICCGWEERACLAKLLNDFNITVESQPLGGTAGELVSLKDGVLATFIEAWPVKCSAEHEVIASLLEQPVIIKRSIGKGQLWVVGDAQFLTNRMLEHAEHGHLNAIVFLRWMLYNIRGKKAQPLTIQGRVINHE